MTKQYEYRCPNCNSTNVHIPTWVNPNTGETHDQIDIGDWCDTCQMGIKAEMIEINTAKYYLQLAEECEKIYAEHGAAAVYDYCNSKALPYHYCAPCDADTPTIADGESIFDCAICGSAKHNKLTAEDMVIVKLIDQKRQGQDCTEEESATIKQWLKNTLICVETGQVQIVADIQHYFPLEYGEYLDETEEQNN